MKRIVTCLLLLLILSACGNAAESDPTPVATDAVVIADPTEEPTVEAVVDSAESDPAGEAPTARGPVEFLNVAIDVPDRSGDFARFDEFGNVVGLDADMMAAIALQAGLGHELIVTRYEGMLNSVATYEFEAAISRILIPERPEAGIVYTDPYLEVGQVLVVRANEKDITSWHDISADMLVAVVGNSPSELAASDVMGLPEAQIISTTSSAAALQLLSDFEVRAVVIDSYDAETYTERYYQRIVLAAQDTADYWISSQAYGIAVAADNPLLLDQLNQAIAELKTIEVDVQAADQWLVTREPIQAGDSLIGTPPDRVLIGAVAQTINFDPAATVYSALDWEVIQNTMSGLLGYDADGNIVPLLAESLPAISADGLQYTFTLREGLRFPDGTPLQAQAVEASLKRQSSTANRLFAVLKDANVDGFADTDAIVARDDRTIQFTLTEPAGQFLSLVATPAYAVVNPNCDTSTFDVNANCDGIGPFTVDVWEPGFSARLVANPMWQLSTPVIDKVEVRLYGNATNLRQALENDAIDVAWHGLNDDEIAQLKDRPAFTRWQGPGTFKSYMVFVHDQEPWDDERVRQAAALAVDREAIAADVFGNERQALYGPIPTGLFGADSAEPTRDLDQARSLLNAAGYGLSNPLAIDLWYLNDGRYTDLESDYAIAIKTQLEETGIFQVTLNGEGWGVYSGQMSTCNYPAFLLGWPPSTQQPYNEGLPWLSYFIYNAATVCSNYESEAMINLFDQLQTATDPAIRSDLYGQIQSLWKQELPTLDLYQDSADIFTLSKVDNVQFNALGLIRYDSLSKSR